MESGAYLTELYEPRQTRPNCSSEKAPVAVEEAISEGVWNHELAAHGRDVRPELSLLRVARQLVARMKPAGRIQVLPHRKCV